MIPEIILNILRIQSIEIMAKNWSLHWMKADFVEGALWWPNLKTHSDDP